MDDLADRFADKLPGFSGTEQARGGPVRKDNLALAVDQKGIRTKFHELAVKLLVFAQLQCLLFQRHPCLGLTQCALNRRHKLGQVAFQDIIRGAIPERLNGDLLTGFAGDENERNLGTFLLRNGQRHETVKGRQAVVGQNDVRRIVLELM